MLSLYVNLCGHVPVETTTAENLFPKDSIIFIQNGLIFFFNDYTCSILSMLNKNNST